ncbi:tetratricopeptide repeat protein [Cytophaga sp. FL35]|uniref:tetratricopeptide repeat protein n=1 Tax=Cytophaga sp. FL35 TaxID=1904456 RepID=UPI001653C7C2|nr:tetratricopeptide repeat protein [Cytophaga sp. FL35]MBC6997237.1 tetratricopeptide repeat protein [Cytophaga sp. FL35]
MKRYIIVIGVIAVFQYALLAQLNKHSVADSLYVIGDYTQAVNHYAQSNDPNASLQIARSYYALGRYDRAIAQYEDVVAKRPEAEIAGFELGKLYFKTKSYREGRKLFSKLIASNDSNPEYHYYLGEIFTELNQPASSLNSYKKAIEKDSSI